MERYKELYFGLLFSSNADSTNSGKTTASDSEASKAKRKTTKSHNTGNGRTKSGKKAGAQPGHPGHSRPKSSASPFKIVDCQTPQEVLDHPDEWVKTGKVKEHSVLDIILQVIPVLYRSPQWKNTKTGKTIYASFPAEAVNEVNYGASVRAFAALLVNYCNVSIRKASDFLNELSDGVINLSAGFISSLKSQFAFNSKEELQDIFKELQLGPYLNVDTTFSKVGGSTSYVHICANDKNVLFQACRNKGKKAVEGTPLEVYQGPVIYDSEAIYWNYGKGHQTCLVHELRYLRRSIENEPNMTWNKDMENFLTKIIHSFKTEGEPDEETLEKWKKEFDEIIETGEKEYKARGKLIWKEGENTVKRLKRHKDAVFYFLNHPGIPFHNNHSEMLARQVKRKTKTCDHFQNNQGLSDYCDMASVLHTEKMHGRNLYTKATEVFKRALQKKRSRNLIPRKKR